jgi:hypothetical protein
MHNLLEYSPPSATFIQEIRTPRCTLHWEPVHFYLDNTTVYDLTVPHTFLRVSHVIVRQILDGNVTRDTIVKSETYACGLTRAATSIKVIPYFRQLGEIILQTKWTLPQTSLVISYWVSLIQLFTLWLPVSYTCNNTQSKTCTPVLA